MLDTAEYGLCDSHKLPRLFICRNLKCPDSNPVCSARECIKKHQHDNEVSLLPVFNIKKELQLRSQANRETVERLKTRSNELFEAMRQKLFEELDRQKAQSAKIQVILEQDEKANQSTFDAIALLEKGEYSALSKTQLSSVYELLAADDSDNKKNLVKDLQKMMERKESSQEAMLEKLFASTLFKRLFVFNVYDTSQTIRVNRFTGESSSWSLGVNKVDALSFTVSAGHFMRGFVHFAITEFPSDGIIKLKVILGTDQAELFSSEFQFDRKDITTNQFEVLFDPPVQLEPDLTYNLSSENIGGQFKAKHGSSTSDAMKPFSVSNCRLDNNGTSRTSGQFKAFLIYKKI